MKNKSKLHVHKKAAIESCLIVPVENSFSGEGYRIGSILTLLILKYQPITFCLFYTGSRLAVSIGVSVPSNNDQITAIRILVSRPCLSRLTTCAEIAARRQGIYETGYTDTREIATNREVYGLWMIKKAFYVAYIESNPYQVSKMFALGIFSILRGLYDRCLTSPALVLVEISKEEKGDGVN